MQESKIAFGGGDVLLELRAGSRWDWSYRHQHFLRLSTPARSVTMPIAAVRWGFFRQIFQRLHEGVGGQRAVEVAVDQGAGGEFAGAEAFDFEEGDEVVVGGFEVFDAEDLFDFLEDFFVAE